MKVLGLLIAAFAITFHALIHLAEIFHGVEYLHTLLKPLIDLSPETADAVLDVIVAGVSCALCLRLDRWLAIRSLTRSELWNKGRERSKLEALEAYANRFRLQLNLRTFALFVVSASALETASKVAIVQHALDAAAEPIFERVLADKDDVLRFVGALRQRLDKAANKQGARAAEGATRPTDASRVANEGRSA